MCCIAVWMWVSVARDGGCDGSAQERWRRRRRVSNFRGGCVAARRLTVTADAVAVGVFTASDIVVRGFSLLWCLVLALGVGQASPLLWLGFRSLASPLTMAAVSSRYVHYTGRRWRTNMTRVLVASTRVCFLVCSHCPAVSLAVALHCTAWLGGV